MDTSQAYHERRARHEREFAYRVSQCADREAHVELAELHEAAARQDQQRDNSSGV